MAQVTAEVALKVCGGNHGDAIWGRRYRWRSVATDRAVQYFLPGSIRVDTAQHGVGDEHKLARGDIDFVVVARENEPITCSAKNRILETRHALVYRRWRRPWHVLFHKHVLFHCPAHRLSIRMTAVRQQRLDDEYLHRTHHIER